MGTTDRMRASDHRRDATVAALRERALDGCLSLDTFAHRVEDAYRARTIDELDALVSDLPRSRLHAVGAWLRRLATGVATPPEPPEPSLEIEVRLPPSAPSV